MLLARSACAIGAQALVATILAIRGSPAPWLDAAPWFPVYATAIDVGCLVFLRRLTRREGIGLLDLIGFERARLLRDTLLGLALVPVSLAFILGGIYASHWLLYGTLAVPSVLGVLPTPAALYGVLVFPIVWGVTEQMTYNGYLAPRFQVLARSTTRAVVLVALAWSLQHSFMPWTLDPRFMLFRLLSPLPNSVFVTVLYLRLRRLVPFALAHAVLDGGSALTSVLLPSLVR